MTARNREFRRGVGCIDLLFSIKSAFKKYFGKGRKLFTAFIDLEKAYDRLDRRIMGDVLMLNYLDGYLMLMEGTEAFYTGAGTCVLAVGDTSEICIETGICGATRDVQCVYGWLYEEDDLSIFVTGRMSDNFER